VLEKRHCSPADVAALADLPAREVLQAQLLGLLQAPMRQLVGVLHAKLASPVYALQAYLEAKQKTA
jgi:large subunit ribosomal protein L10